MGEKQQRAEVQPSTRMLPSEWILTLFFLPALQSEGKHALLRHFSLVASEGGGALLPVQPVVLI